MSWASTIIWELTQHQNFSQTFIRCLSHIMQALSFLTHNFHVSDTQVLRFRHPAFWRSSLTLETHRTRLSQLFYRPYKVGLQPKQQRYTLGLNLTLELTWTQQTTHTSISVASNSDIAKSSLCCWLSCLRRNNSSVIKSIPSDFLASTWPLARKKEMSLSATGVWTERSINVDSLYSKPTYEISDLSNGAWTHFW